MAKKMLIDATHAEETRVVVLSGNRLDEYDFETSTKKQIKGNIYLAKVTRVEPSLQACFIEFGGNRHGFLAFGEIHPDYWQIPIADREALLAEERRLAEREDNGDDTPEHAPFPAPSASAHDEPEEREQTPTAIGVSPSASDSTVDIDGRGVQAAPDADAARAAEADQSAAIGIDAPRVVAPEPSAGDEAPLAADAEPAAPPVKLESLGGDAAEEEEEEETRRRRFKPMRHYKIQEVIKRRQVLLVQVVKEERGTKGAALTTYISLAGRYCVLMPNTTRGGGISRRITSQQDRKRLKDIMRDLDLPDGMAVILRTAGMERDKPDIRRDYEYLMRLWDDVRELTLNSRAPALVYEEGSLIKRAIRDLYSRDIDEIQVEGREGYDAARAFMKMLMPDHAEKIRLYDDPQVPLFQRHQVEAQLDEMHDSTVRLRSGGYIVLNQTEALVAIDVNSGRATRERHIEETALKTNLEAADEVARQIRLRDLAGLIVIDFIDMEDNRHISQVERRLKDAMRSDRARIQIGRISPFGLLELSRQRLRPSLAEVSTHKCPHCDGTGQIRSTESTALRVLRGIEEEGLKARSSALKVSLPAVVAIYILNQKRSALAAIEQRYGLDIAFEPDAAMVPPEYRIERLRARERTETGPAPIRAGFDHGADEQPADATGEPAETPAIVAPRGWDRDEPAREDAEPGDGAAQDMGGEDGGRGRGRRRRRRRGRGRGREDGQQTGPRTGEPQRADDDSEQREDTGAPQYAAASDAGAFSQEVAGDGPATQGSDSAPSAEAGGRALREPGGEDDGGRRRRRGRRGGRRRRGEELGAIESRPADQGLPSPAAEPAPQAPDMDSDLRLRARELYAQESRFAPSASAVDTPPADMSAHEWPWNRRAEQAAPSSAPVAPVAAPAQVAAPAPIVETVVEIAPEPPAQAPSLRPSSPAPAPAAAPAPAQAVAPPQPEPEPAPEPDPEPKGPPRRGWWRRLTN